MLNVFYHRKSWYGSGNNLGIKNIKTDYAFILNPDVILEKDTIEEIINASKKLSHFGILLQFQIIKISKL
jgi:GT2 family glycosyltransferase